MNQPACLGSHGSQGLECLKCRSERICIATKEKTKPKAAKREIQVQPAGGHTLIEPSFVVSAKGLSNARERIQSDEAEAKLQKLLVEYNQIHKLAEERKCQADDLEATVARQRQEIGRLTDELARYADELKKLKAVLKNEYVPKIVADKSATEADKLQKKFDSLAWESKHHAAENKRLEADIRDIYLPRIATTEAALAESQAQAEAMREALLTAKNFILTVVYHYSIGKGDPLYESFASTYQVLNETLAADAAGKALADDEE